MDVCTGFLFEKALSMDNVFMIALIYATFGLIAGGVLVPL